MTELIHCPRCEKDLPEGMFGECRARPSGKNLYCRKCSKQKVHDARARNRARGLRADGKPRKEHRKVTIAKLPKPIKDGSIDAGLLVLSKIVPYGVILTHQEIAAVCGCARSRIGQIENKALAKLKTRIQTDSELRAKIAAFV